MRFLVGQLIITTLLFLASAWMRYMSNAARREPAPPEYFSAWRVVWLIAAWAGFFVVPKAVALGLVWVPVVMMAGWPHRLAELLAAPFGAVRLAHRLERMSGGSFRTLEHQTSWAVPSGAAFLRRPTEDSAAFIEAQLVDVAELGSSGACGLALVALGQGDRAAAREIFATLARLPRRTIAPAVARFVQDFAIVDALGRGDLRRATLSGYDWPRTRLARLLTLLGERWLGDVPVVSFRLWLAWALAPRRRQTLPLVRRAIAGPPERATSAAAPPGLSAITTILASPELARMPGVLERTIDALDRYRTDVGVFDALASRAAVVGARTDAGTLRDRIADALETQVVDVVLECQLPVPVASASAAGESIRRRVRDARFAVVRDLMADLEQRLDSGTDLPEIDEWRAWGRLCAACDDVCADASLADRRAVFETVYYTATSWAVRLVNVRARRILGRGIFHWLEAMAHAAKATERYDLLDSNKRATEAACSTGALEEAHRLSDAIGVKRWAIRGLLLLLGGFSLSFALIALRRRLDPSSGVTPSNFSVVCSILAVLCVLVPGVVVVSGLGLLAELAVDGETLTVRNLNRNFPARRGDLARVRPGPGSLLNVALARRPPWLRRSLWVPMPSRAAAREAARRLDEAGFVRSAEL